jgi:L-ascorbate metabolism protein UlaG (beta-lactamase superfamily)
MSNTGQARLTFHKNSFFELSTPTRTLFIDPVFSHERRGRRVADELRSCDYVLATSVTPWFEDVLDVLDEGDATLIAAPSVTRMVSRELGIKRKRLLDLEPWERASETGLKVTALPISASIGMESAIEEGTSIMKDIGNIFPRGTSRIPMLGGMLGGNIPFLGSGGIPMLQSGLPFFTSGITQATRAVEGVTSIARPPKSMGRMGDMLGVDVGGLTGGRPGLGFLFEFEGFPTLMHLADGVHAGTTDDDFEDIADICEPDVVVMHVQGMDVEPVVRAVRALSPKTVLLYRSRDPYAEGRRGQTLPISSFVGAIEEGAPGCEALHMRKRDTYILERSSVLAAKAAAAPAATPKYAPPSATPKPAPKT